MNKVLIFLCVVGTSLAQYTPNKYEQKNSQYSGSQYGQQELEPAKYEYKYDVSSPEAYLDFGHQENRDGDNTKGSYHVLLPDGRKQIVEYTVDAYGYHPKIRYEESSSQGGNYQGYMARNTGSYQGKNQYQSGQKTNY